MKVAFLGAGKMGSAMISRLMWAGHQVTVYNRTPEKLTDLARRGAFTAESPAAAASSAEVILSMVMDDDASRQVWQGADGALAGHPAPETVLIECSTVSHRRILEFHDSARVSGLESLDCPVAGRPTAAAAGKLTAFVGGELEVAEAVTPLLQSFATSVVRFGPHGSGTAFKLLYNMVGAIQLASLAEAMAACDALNIDLLAAANAFASGGTGSTHVKHHGPLMASGERVVPPPFTGRGRLKDLDYAIAFLKEHHIDTVVGKSAADLFEMMVATGEGEQGDTQLFDVLKTRFRTQAHTQNPTRTP